MGAGVGRVAVLTCGGLVIAGASGAGRSGLVAAQATAASTATAARPKEMNLRLLTMRRRMSVGPGSETEGRGAPVLS